jgi:hypothetical protein
MNLSQNEMVLLTNNARLLQAEGLREGSRGLERLRKPPVRAQKIPDPEGVVEALMVRLLHPFRVLKILFSNPGVSLRSTPGYLLATLQVVKTKAAVPDC